MNYKHIDLLPGQESVWDYPRPPRLESTSKHIQVVFNQQIIVDTIHAWRILETSHPPVYYIPQQDVRMEFLRLNQSTSYCEWKGKARYYDVILGDRQAERAAWFYPAPTLPYEQIRNYLAFYAGKMDSCTVDGEVVQPQPGNFYGGWITDSILGPFKGESGSQSW